MLGVHTLIGIGEGFGMVPKGTHDWHKFLTPEELAAHVEAAGLRVIDRKGLSFSPAAGFHLSDNLALDYLLFRFPDGWHGEIHRADDRFGSDHYPLVAALTH